MNLTFKKVILLSVLAVLLGVSIVYALSYGFKPESSSDSHPPGSLPIAIDAHLFVFAYSGDGFVEASVTITGPESPNPPVRNGTLVNATTLNGKTSTDLQNPLRFLVWPGVYSVFGTYGSAPPQNATVNVTQIGSYGEAVLNFGSSPPLPLGHLIVSAWADDAGGFVQASVNITGPEFLNATIRYAGPRLTPEGIFEQDPSVFTLASGAYTVTAAYDSAPPQNVTVNVTAGTFTGIFFDFGVYPPP